MQRSRQVGENELYLYSSLKMTEIHPKYRPDVDGLRALAILSVLSFHAFPEVVTGGYIGVDVFFVISGFLISSIIFRGLEAGKFSFMDFYVRRIKRIFPALLCVLTAVLAVGWFTLFADEYYRLGKHVATGAAFIANIALWRESGYFDHLADTKPLLHLWSLGIEEQFYFAWPLAVFLFWRLRWNLWFLILPVMFFSARADVRAVFHDHKIEGFYLPHLRLWELMVGGALAYGVLKFPRAFTNETCVWKDALSWGGLIAILGAAAFFNKDISFPGYWAIIPTLGSAAIIAAGPNTWPNRNLFSLRLFVWIGLISYPLYLWHWPILSYLHLLVSVHPSIGLRVAAVLLSVLLAWLTYRLVETPVRKGDRPVFISVVLSVLMMGVGFSGWLVFSKIGFQGRPAESEAKVKLHEFQYGIHWEGWTTCSVLPQTQNGGCWTLKPGQLMDLVVIGDSHAGHLGAGLLETFKARKENVGIILYAGCFPALPQKHGRETAFECQDDSIRRGLEYTANTPDIRNVLLAGYGVSKIEGHRFYEDRKNSEWEIQLASADMERGLGESLKLLLDAGKNVFFLIDPPELHDDPIGCVTRPLLPIQNRANCAVTIDLYRERNKVYFSVLERLKAQFPAVHFIDGGAPFCSEHECSAFDSNGDLLYSSEDHLNARGSRLLFSKIAQQLFGDLR